MKETVKTILKRMGVYQFLFRLIFENRLTLQVWSCAWRYRQLCKKAGQKPKDEKIRVLFIVSEIAKW